eukprot:g17721.t1
MTSDVLEKLRSQYVSVALKRVSEIDHTQHVPSCLELPEKEPAKSTQPHAIPDRKDDENTYRVDASDTAAGEPIYKKHCNGNTDFLVTLTTVPKGMEISDFMRLFVKCCKRKKIRALHAAGRAELGKEKEALHFHVEYAARKSHPFKQLRTVVRKELRAWEKLANPRNASDEFSPNWKELRFDMAGVALYFRATY